MASIPSPIGRAARTVRPSTPTPTADPDFPGCDPVSLPTWDDVWAYDGRIEYWLRETGTAWVLRDAGPVHETAPNLLSELLTRMCLERGSRFLLAGAVYMMERDEDGTPRQVLVADQTVYLDRSVWRPRDPAVVLGVDPLPDVILEVDHTTDVRRNKLPVYEAWGFPEVWVDTPDEPSPNRPRGLRPGLTIYVLDGGRFRRADESRAFPTWTAAQLHAALNESRLSPRTLADLTRVGRRLGRQEGTTPDDDPQLGRHRRPGPRRGAPGGPRGGAAPRVSHEGGPKVSRRGGPKVSRRGAPRASLASGRSSAGWPRRSSGRSPRNGSPTSWPASRTPIASPRPAT